MASPRLETTFKIAGTEYKRRPTFDKVAMLEQRFTAILPLMNRMAEGRFGVHEVRDALQIILGNPNEGGPRAVDLADEALDNYGPLLKKISEFVANAVTDTGARPSQ